MGYAPLLVKLRNGVQVLASYDAAGWKVQLVRRPKVGGASNEYANETPGASLTNLRFATRRKLEKAALRLTAR
jgi:hypothetical protein